MTCRLDDLPLGCGSLRMAAAKYLNTCEASLQTSWGWSEEWYSGFLSYLFVVLDSGWNWFVCLRSLVS